MYLCFYLSALLLSHLHHLDQSDNTTKSSGQSEKAWLLDGCSASELRSRWLGLLWLLWLLWHWSNSCSRYNNGVNTSALNNLRGDSWWWLNNSREDGRLDFDLRRVDLGGSALRWNGGDDLDWNLSLLGDNVGDRSLGRWWIKSRGDSI